MADRAQFIIRTEADRRKVADWAKKTGQGTIVEFRKATRSHVQNALLWARLGEISRGVEWYGRYLSSEDWKNIFTASLRKAEVVPGIDPGTVVVLGQRTSKMTIPEMNDLLHLIDAFAAERGIEFNEPGDATPEALHRKAGQDVPSSPGPQSR